MGQPLRLPTISGVFKALSAGSGKMIWSGRFEITEKFGCFCLYRLVRNSSREVIKKVLVMNTADLEKAIIKMVEQMRQRKNEQRH
ncbi:hypothetical protein [Mannheimia pernigra]|uniref:hypothetical protein n=1 Tax=Mannheimia pernigra TaxID=111844 RepID=UPI001319417A|nr:hypothetical protein [Mannheimia pernigra]QHB17896.1 hypothetical protein GM695_07590 [Mannheimia pernigra]